MTVEENGFVEISFDFGKNDWAQFLDFDYFWFGSFDFELFDPASDVFGGFFEETIGLPILIKVSGEVWDFDVLH